MNYYELLEINENTSEEVIKMAYKALAKKYHPDTSNFDELASEAMMKNLNEAYEVLMDSSKREEYDRILKLNKTSFSANTDDINEDNFNETTQNDLNNKSNNFKNNNKNDYKSDGYPISFIVIFIIFIGAIWFENLYIFAILLLLLFHRYSALKYNVFGILINTISIVFVLTTLITMIIFNNNNDSLKKTIYNLSFGHITMIETKDKIIEYSMGNEVIASVLKKHVNVDNIKATSAKVDTNEDVSIYSKLPVTSYKFLGWYVKDNNIKLNVYYKEDDIKVKLESLLESINSTENLKFINEDVSLFGKRSYEETNQDSTIIYVGEMSKNKPDGIGIIGRLLQDPKDYTYSISGIEYMGEFKEGKFDGYGMLFNIPSDDDIFRLYHIYGDDYTEHIQDELCFMLYDGEFEEGEYNGKGNRYYYINLVEHYYNFVSIYTDYFEVLDTVKDLDILVGNFKKGECSKGKYYTNGYLYYDGEFKNDMFNGKGKLYDESGQKLYSGKWKNGEYE